MTSERQEQIINESIKIISKGGIQNLTIKTIAKEIGVSEPAIYRHFENKMAILSGILKKFETGANYMLESIRSDTHLSTKDKLRKLFLARCGHFSKNPYMATVIFSEEIFRFDKNLSASVKKIIDMHQFAIEGIIWNAKQNNELPETCDEENLSLIILGSLRLIVTKWRLSNHEFNLEEKGANLWKQIEKLIFNKKV